MKTIWKKGLSLLLALVLAASCLPVTVLAEECPHTAYLEGKCYSCGAPCTHLVYVGGVCPICGAAEPVTPETTPAPTETAPAPTETTPVPTETPAPTDPSEPAGTEPPAETTAPTEPQETTPSAPVDEAVEAVKAQIDALPTVEALSSMTIDEKIALHNGAYLTAGSAYNALTEEQKAQVDASKLMALAAYFADPSNLQTVEEHTCNGITWTPITKLSEITGPGNYYLDGNLELGYFDRTISGNGTVNLCLNGVTAAYSSEVTVAAGTTLNICDCQTGSIGFPIKNLGTTNIYSGAFVKKIKNEGKLNIYGGSFITGESPASVHNNNGTLVIQNGTFGNNSGNAVENDGGSISISDGNFTSACCSVFNDAGTLEISGGTYTSNGSYATVDVDGGSATISNGTFTQTNGAFVLRITTSATSLIVTDGTFNSTGDAVCGNAGTLDIQGGTFTTTGKDKNVLIANAAVNVSGGQFKSEQMQQTWIKRGEHGKFQLAGGTFIGGLRLNLANVNDGGPVLPGSLADGYAYYQNGQVYEFGTGVNTQIIKDGDVTVQKMLYTIIATADPVEVGTVTGGGTYESGASVTVTATANADYKFVNWTENGNEVSTEASYTFTAAANRNLVAVFEPIHSHSWSITASDGTITKECTANGCPENEKIGTATIQSSGPYVYNKTPYAATVATSGNLDGEDFPITYTDFNGSTSTDAPIAAGSYIASITLSEASASVDFVIVCRELSGISAATRAYDGTNTVTFSGVQGILNGDDAAVIGTMSDPNAGEEKSVTLSITGEDAANYCLSTDKATATITPAHVTVTANDQAISYGDAIPELTYQAEGVVQNETLTGTLATTATAGSNVGTYPITQGTLTTENNPNYNIAFTGASVVIGPKNVNPLTLIPEHQTYVHTGSDITIAVKVQDGTVTLPEDQYTLTCGDTKKIGPVTITADPVEGGNYDFQPTNVTVLILPDTSSLTQETITADDQEKIDALQQQMDQIDPNDFLPLSEEAKEAWKNIQEQLKALEQTIQEAEETSDEITNAVDSLPEVPTTGDLDQIEELLETYEDIKGNLTEEQKQALADEIQKLEALKEALKKTNQKYQGLLNQVEGMKGKDLSFSDKQDIEKLKADIDEQKQDPQLTEAQKNELDQAKADLDALFAEADTVTVQLNQLPATADPDDEKAINAYKNAKKAYEDLGTQKDMADPKAVEKLNALRDALKAYKIIKGHGATYIKSTGGSLEFTANGLFEHYDSVEIDGKAVDKSNFDTKQGSTIVTLKASYVKTLSNGEHEIKVHFRDADNPELDGYAQGKFSVVQSTGVADPTNPKTGDGFPMAQWSALAGISLLCAAALLLNRKKIY